MEQITHRLKLYAIIKAIITLYPIVTITASQLLNRTVALTNS